ncbi:hypothetical protein NF868_10585 [Bacillus zhangzhouensis]|nr:hypothetical protein NF868_10585 [Bacillus zhangzhouensis]
MKKPVRCFVPDRLFHARESSIYAVRFSNHAKADSKKMLSSDEPFSTISLTILVHQTKAPRDSSQEHGQFQTAAAGR